MSAKTGAQLIAEERQRQQEIEGFTAAHDDEHDCSDMMMAAEAYIVAADPYSYIYGQLKGNEFVLHEKALVPIDWPGGWNESWFKPDRDNPIRNLVKSGALIAAEIDRLQREKNISR